jgi:hypothetical protein
LNDDAWPATFLFLFRRFYDFTIFLASRVGTCFKPMI